MYWGGGGMSVSGLLYGGDWDDWRARRREGRELNAPVLLEQCSEQRRRL